MAHGLNLHDGTGVIARDPGLGVLLQYGRDVPPTNAVGFAPGCRFVKIDATSIGTTEYVNIGTRAAANFVAAGLNGIVAQTFIWNAPDDTPFFVADRAYTIVSITARVLVAGSDGGNVTAQIRRAASGTAIASGTAVHAGTINLKGTVDTNQTVTVNSSSLPLGSSLGFDVTGTTTAARGIVTTILIPA